MNEVSTSVKPFNQSHQSSASDCRLTGLRLLRRCIPAFSSARLESLLKATAGNSYDATSGSLAGGRLYDVRSTDPFRVDSLRNEEAFWIFFVGAYELEGVSMHFCA